MDSSSSSNGNLKLVEAVFHGNLQLVKRLVTKLNDKGIVVANVKDCNMALNIAAFGGKTPICKYLIEELKLDVNIKDQEGKSPLYHAIVGERFPTALYLLEIGANPNDSDGDKMTPLHLAAKTGHTEVLRLLISKGAIVDAKANGVMGTCTPLLLASALGKKEAVKILLDHNANPNQIFNHVQTPLTIAIITRSYGCVQVLLEAGVDTNLGARGATPIEIAVFEGEVEITKWLLKAGANPNVVNMYDDSPIETAALHCNLELIMILLPVTTRNPKVQDWSCSGMMEYIHSNEVKEQKKIKRTEYFVVAKLKGGEEVKKKNYPQAIYWYSEAFEANPNDVTDAILMSNRSLCYAKLNQGVQALSDARECLRLRPDWPKTYYRVGAAWNVLKRYSDAAYSFRVGLKLDPSNKVLKAAYRKAVLADLRDMGI